MYDVKESVLHAVAASAAFLLCTVVLESTLLPSLKRLLAKNPKNKPEHLDATAKLAVTRIVGTIHNVIQIPLAFIVLFDKDLRADPLFATSTQSKLLVVIAVGYFTHDFIMCCLRFEAEGPLYMLHAASCLSVYGYGIFKGYLHYLGAAFILWELSTPFVHLRWFMYKMGWDKSPLYLYNAFLMMVVFFGCRNVWGTYMSYKFFQYSAHELGPHGSGKFSPVQLWLYRVANLALNALNVLWFWKMLSKALEVLFKGRSAADVSHDKDE